MIWQRSPPKRMPPMHSPSGISPIQPALLQGKARGASRQVLAEYWRLAASLEHLAAKKKQRLGEQLLTLLEKFDGGPVGIDTLAAAIGEDRGTLEDLVEPFLIQGGFLERTPRGRRATERARRHLGIPHTSAPAQTRLL